MNLTDLKTMAITRDGNIATLTLDNPDQLNAVGPEMHSELSWVFRALAADDGIDVVIFTGAGRAFCAGGNLEWMEESAAEPCRFLPIIEEIKQIVLSMLEFPKPLICRMNGDAIGLGATLALGCDIIVAADSARFGDPHVRVGLTAGDGAAIILPHIIGHMRARELLLTGDLVTAAEGKEMGLINHVVAEAELDAKVAQIAQKLARGAQQAIRFTKIALNAGLRAAAIAEIDMLAAYEALTVMTPDHREALAAMREKRRPQFGKPPLN
ncbi:MAG: enoyl-CoA hydratase/isomerase family protein [Sphingomonadales bacterium]|nr:MAG: enoyl-CoA hydratase/isomerase family protein [Sphingomonadales bacterium]